MVVHTCMTCKNLEMTGPQTGSVSVSVFDFGNKSKQSGLK